jgi:hypothetical protein
LLGQDHRRREGSGEFASVGQVHHFKQLLVMRRRTIAKQQPTKRIVRDQPDATIGVTESPPERFDGTAVAQQPERHCSGATEFDIATR